MTISLRRVCSALLVLALLAAMAVPAFGAAEAAYEEVPFPKTGVLTEKNDSDFGVLKINGPDDMPTYVKIYSYNTDKQAKAKEPTKTLFIRAGKSLTIDMPKGNYIMRYATGAKWEEEMFGTKEAVYSQADTVLNFATRDAGYEVTLKFVTNGNLSSTSVDKAAF